MMQAVESLGVDVGTAAACRALALPRATLYRRRAAVSSAVVPAPRPTPARAPTPSEREDVLNVSFGCDARKRSQRRAVSRGNARSAQSPALTSLNLQHPVAPAGAMFDQQFQETQPMRCVSTTTTGGDRR